MYLILGRYVLSFHFASGVPGRIRREEDKDRPPFFLLRPVTAAAGRGVGEEEEEEYYPLSSSSRHHHRYHRVVRSPIILHGTNDLGEHQMIRDDRKWRRRRQVLTWLPRRFRSFYRRSGLGGTWWSTSRRTPVVAEEFITPSKICEYYSILADLGEATIVEKAPQGANWSQEVSPTLPSSVETSNLDRTATADLSTDLTGRWRLLVTTDFERQYDKYLTLLGQPMLVRSVAISIIGMTTEETRQDENGRQLWIKGTNPRGAWERVLTASTDTEGDDRKLFAIQTIDKETVQAEAWWENDGTMHNSWLRGVSKYGGGSFESIRYLESPDVLVCESAFHPDDKQREVARVTWRFARTSASA
jgi:hypothetical protein